MMVKYWKIFVFFIFIPVFGWAQSHNTISKDKILVISSYSPLKEGSNHIISSFLEELHSHISVDISVEYMDSESYPEFTHWIHWLESLFEAYETSPRLVVLIGGEVWAAYRECCRESWKEVPVILGGVKGGYIDYKNWKNSQVNTVKELPLFPDTFGDFKVTGYYLIDYIEENLRLIKDMQPLVKEVAFCYDNRYHHHFLGEYIRSLAHKIGDFRLHCWLGSNMTTAELIDSVSAWPGLVLLNAGWYTDRNGYSHAFSMLQNELSRQVDKVVYEVMDLDINAYNFIGGYFVSGKAIGKDLAGLVAKVYTCGIENSPSFGLTPSEPEYHLNYLTLNQMDLNTEFLPEKVNWYNVPPTVWEEYNEILVIVLGVTFAVLIIILIVLRYRWWQEQHYLKSAQRLQKLLQAMPDMAVIFDTNYYIRDIINPNEFFLLGLKPEELIGKPMSALAVQKPEFVELVRLVKKGIGHVLQTKKVFTFNYNMSYEGTEFYEEVRMVPFDSDKIISFVQNVTANVVTKKEVLKYKNFLESIIEHMPLGILVKNVSDNYRYIYCNKSVFDFYDREGKSFIGHNDFELGDPLATQYRKEDEEVLQSNIPVSYKRENIDKEGNIRWAVVTKVRLVNNDGSCYIIAILVDMTNDRKKEMELENIRNELTIALEAGSLAAWIYRVEPQLFSSLYQETISGEGLAYTDARNLAHPDDREKFERFIGDLLSGEYEKKKEILRFFRNGKYDFFETHATGIRSTQTGEIVQIIGTEKKYYQGNPSTTRNGRKPVQNRSRYSIQWHSAMGL